MVPPQSSAAGTGGDVFDAVRDTHTADGHAADTPTADARAVARIRAFTAPSTRMLLTGEGPTTTLLEALTGEEVRVRCLGQGRVRAVEAEGNVPALLRVADGQEVLVRRSHLTRPDGEVLSVVRVVARLDLFPDTESQLSDHSGPVHAALHTAGTGFRRTVLDAGLRPWRTGAPHRSAFRTYLMWHERQSMVLISERFNPAFVSATTREAE